MLFILSRFIFFWGASSYRRTSALHPIFPVWIVLDGLWAVAAQLFGWSFVVRQLPINLSAGIFFLLAASYMYKCYKETRNHIYIGLTLLISWQAADTLSYPFTRFSGWAPIAFSTGILAGLMTGIGLMVAALIEDQHVLEGEVAVRKAAEGMLQRREREFRSLAENSPDVIARFDREHCFLYISPTVESVMGYPPHAFLGKPVGAINPVQQPGEAAAVAPLLQAIERVFKRELPQEAELTLLSTHHGERVLDVHLVPEWNAGGGVDSVLAIARDITERKKTEDRIHTLAFYDQLTGLPNRPLLVDRLHQAMNVSERTGCYGALFLIDLDNFKTLNDTLGHNMGDLLLTQVASRLSGCVRGSDTVARWGGDEFLVLILTESKIESEAAADTKAVALKILTQLNVPYALEGVPYRCTPSLGATIFHGHGSSVENLTKEADIAMYKSKNAGRNTISFFDPALQLALMERAVMEAQMREALLNSQFVLHFQPQMEGANRLVGAEALVRWQHPVKGLMGPDQFIPVAEETGMILQLGEWVLETACTQLAAWAFDSRKSQLSLAVNVSTRQFRQADFVEGVLAVVKRTGANPHRLKLELTESLLLENTEDVIEKMAVLKSVGVKFSLDDFGTGYSSLYYLKRLPLEQLKIDRSFVRDVLIDANDAAIARTIVALAQALGLQVIAEGVETEEQRAFLASVGCHSYQGYLFSRPVPLVEFDAFYSRVTLSSSEVSVLSE
jgi:diguanylate cyclase (GGDEF)-like protein/PAS domain S-box-containing protein